jgi:hypothetical protein
LILASGHREEIDSRRRNFLVPKRVLLLQAEFHRLDKSVFERSPINWVMAKRIYGCSKTSFGPGSPKQIGMSNATIRQPDRSPRHNRLTDIEGIAQATNPPTDHHKPRFWWPQIKGRLRQRKRIQSGVHFRLGRLAAGMEQRFSQSRLSQLIELFHRCGITKVC